MVYTAAEPGSACPRAESPKFRSFFLYIFRQPNGCFPPDRQKVPKFTAYKRICFLLKGYESVIFCMRRARPEILRP
jgi:hypothetical protein